MKRRTSRNLLIGALIGGVMGSLIAFLYAPKSGSKLRRDINKNMNDSLLRFKGSGKTVAEKFKTVADSTLDKLQSAINAGIETYKREGEKVKTSKEMLEESLAEEQK